MDFLSPPPPDDPNFALPLPEAQLLVFGFFLIPALRGTAQPYFIGNSKKRHNQFWVLLFVLCSVLTPGLIENDVKQQQ